MPDDDRFPARLSPTWRKVLRGFELGESPVRITGDMVIALADTVRRVHGVALLPSMAERMQQAAISGQPFQRTRIPGRRHVPTEIAEQAAAALSVTMQRELALVSPAEASLLLARKILAELAYHYGFDRMAQKLIKDADSPGQFRVVVSEMLSSEPVSRLAERFLVRPTGDGLRAPPRKLQRLSPTQLLATPLEDL